MRLKERLGHAKAPRPIGKLIWIHAASVGEANAAMPLIEAVLASSPSVQMLLTTVTVTSAALMRERLPARAVHQFAPVDTEQALTRFLDYWRPDMALWVDSELWPNMLMLTRARGVAMGLVNARLSERSFRRWQMLAGGLIREMLGCFSLCFAQSEQDAMRLRALGIISINAVCNLKYDAPELPCSADELVRLKSMTAGRPLWLAASTHSGEEMIIAAAHRTLKQDFPALLTIIVPRHAARGQAIVESLTGMRVAIRSKNEPVTGQTDIYLADTMGELGLFYRLCPIAFMGGSLVPHGGQNPLEAARLGNAIIVGPHTQNFAAIYAAFEREGACVSVRDKAELARVVKRLLTDGAEGEKLRHAALKHVTEHAGAVGQIMKALQPYLG